MLTYVSNCDGRGSRHPLNKERAPEPQAWIIARRFPGPESALSAFIKARDLLLSDDLDASVLRFRFGSDSHIALLGESPLPAQAMEKMRSIIEAGSEATTLPDEIAVQLRARRQQFKGTGLDYLERRSLPGSDGGA